MNVQLKIRLVQAIASVGAPVDTVTITGNSAVATYMPNASAADIQRGNAIINGFDWSDAAQQAWEDLLDPKRGDLRTKAAAAINQIDAYLALPSPTAAQSQTAISVLAQIVRALILRVGELN